MSIVYLSNEPNRTLVSYCFLLKKDLQQLSASARNRTGNKNALPKQLVEFGCVFEPSTTFAKSKKKSTTSFCHLLNDQKKNLLN